MYKCLNCGATFEEAKLGYTLDGEETIICPDDECGLDDLEILHLCRCERKYITSSQDRCQMCETEIIEAMQEARERIENGCNVDHQQASEDIIWWVEREC